MIVITLILILNSSNAANDTNGNTMIAGHPSGARLGAARAPQGANSYDTNDNNHPPNDNHDNDTSTNTTSDTPNYNSI